MRKSLLVSFFVALTLCLSVSVFAEEGRLNFMLINLTGQDITDVKICPTYYPQYESENLLKTPLDPRSHIYIGPNYYGEQIFWNIAIKWANGDERTFTKLRLTRYNTYTVYSTPQGIRIRQSYEPEYARYAFGSEVPTYMGLKPEVKVNATPPKKLDALPAASVNLGVESGKTTSPRSDKLAFSSADNLSEKALAIKTSVALTRDGKNSSVSPKETFKNGDKIQLRFAANKDGHIYWVTKEGDGKYRLLFPKAKEPAGSGISGNTAYALPIDGPLQFDENGTETLFAILAPNAVVALDRAVQLQDEGKLEEASTLIADIVNTHGQKRNANQIVLQEDDDEDVNTQSQLADGEFVGEYEISGE